MCLVSQLKILEKIVIPSAALSREESAVSPPAQADSSPIELASE
jgi:hypothetical protein